MMRIALLLFPLYLFNVLLNGNIEPLTAEMHTVSPFQQGFPEPPASKERLFYVQRTMNTNTIVYDLNYKNGEIDMENPVHIYWIRYAEKGQNEELSYIQRNYAYGLKTRVTDKEKKHFILNFNSYTKRDIYLYPSGDTFRAYMKIDGKMCQLKKLFVQIEGGSFWIPNVKYVDITGLDGAQTVTERFVP